MGDGEKREERIAKSEKTVGSSVVTLDIIIPSIVIQIFSGNSKRISSHQEFSLRQKKRHLNGTMIFTTVVMGLICTRYLQP
jgi:hypothetical protein